MRSRRSIAGALLLLAACAQPQPKTPSPPTIGPATISALVDLMRFEDTRRFDVGVFQGLAASPSELIRARTMLAAGRIGDRGAEPLLITGLADPSDSVRAYAAFALGELGDSSANAVQALGTLSRTRGVPAAEALAALGKIGGSTARDFVAEALRTRKTGPELREALLAAWRFPRQPAMSALLVAAAHSSSPEIRWRAVYALTRGGPDPANVPDFRAWLTDVDPLVRSFAVRGLRATTVDSANQRSPSAAALLTALADSDAHMRINVANVLAGYRDSAYSAAVVPLLHDSDLNVRVAAAQALGLLKGSVAAAALEQTARDTAQRIAIRGSALAALTGAGPARALPLITEYARSGDLVTRLYGARALAQLRGSDAFTLARTLALDADPRVATAAVAAAASIAGDTVASARAFFIEKLASADPSVRAEALSGLTRFAAPGDEAVAFEAFDRAVRDTIEDPGVAAAQLIGKLADKNPAVRRTFIDRFPLDSIRIAQVRKAVAQALKLEDHCCTIDARPAVYQRVVRELLVPALLGQPLPRVRINTAGGSIEIELLSADAPLTVDNFLSLARKGYFNGGRWHRVVPNFVLQDGDPSGTGNGGPGYAIRDEINGVRYLRGTVGMALSGPDTGGSQFFITHSPQPHLDGGYTVFGRVVAGMDTAERVIQDAAIQSIEVIIP